MTDRAVGVTAGKWPRRGYVDWGEGGGAGGVVGEGDEEGKIQVANRVETSFYVAPLAPVGYPEGPSCRSHPVSR